MEDKPLSPKWFIQAVAFLAVAGMTIPLVAGVSEFINDELRSPASIERGSCSTSWFKKGYSMLGNFLHLLI